MATDIKCPNCGNSFDVEGVIAGELEQQLKKEYEHKFQQSLKNIDQEKNKLIEDQRLFDEKKKRENEIFSQKIAQERQKLEVELQEQLRKSITSDFENKFHLLEQNNRDNEEKLKLARQKELEFLQMEQQLKNREAELEISVQRKIQEERSKLSEEIRKQEEQKVNAKEEEHQFRVKELEKKLEVQRGLVEEMKRKAEQGSTQMQGEVLELLLEEILHEHFPLDIIEEVSKGSEGADCIQTIRNSIGKECGKIIYEGKRTRNWSNNWIGKLKTDMRSCGAEVAILVTQAFPKDMERFGEREGVWVCQYEEVLAVASILRNAIIRVEETKKSEENKGEKMQMLYNYLIGSEFRQQVEAIVEGFMAMKQSITKERMQMEKLWKEREKQLDKVLLNTSGMYGSVRGIAGTSVENIPLLEIGVDENEDDMAH